MGRDFVRRTEHLRRRWMLHATQQQPVPQLVLIAERSGQESYDSLHHGRYHIILMITAEFGSNMRVDQRLRMHSGHGRVTSD